MSQPFSSIIMLQKIFRLLLLLLFFVLPWQTRWIYAAADLNGGFWEYGSGSLYGTEILLWLILIVFFIDFFKNKKIIRSFFAKDAFVLLIALWGGGVVQGVLSVWQFFSQHIFASKWLGIAEQSAGRLGASVVEFGHERWLRAYGSFGSPNALGIYLAVILIFGLSFYTSVKDGKFRILFTIGQIFILSGLILSFSRGAWVAAAVGLITCAVLRARKSAFKPLVRQYIFYFLLILFFIFTLQPILSARFNLQNRLEHKSIAERVSQIGEWKNIFFEHPFLGVGLNQYTLYEYRANPNLPVWNYQPIHNIYLLSLAEVGILGVVLLVVLWAAFLRLIYRRNRDYLPVLLTLFIAGFFDHWLWSMFTGAVFWWVIFIVGLAPRRGKGC